MKTEHLIEKIVLKNQYRISQKEKEKILLPILKNRLNIIELIPI
jgi:hypothetical protein